VIGPKTSVANRPHWVTFQDPGPAVPDGDGGFTQSWFNLVPPSLYVSIEPATAKDLERLAAGTVLATASHIVTGPYHPQVTTATRIVFGTRVFAITGVANPEERCIETICVCVELLDAVPVEDTNAFDEAFG
jgi:head-tail adaptor